MTAGQQLALDWNTPDETRRMTTKLALVRPSTTPPPEKAASSTPMVLDRRGTPRPVATRPGFRAGQPPVTKGRRYPPDPMTPEEVDLLLKHLSTPRSKFENRNGRLSRLRLRAFIVLLWRSGLRISEALALEHRDLNPDDMCITVRHGKGDKRRIVVMDQWGWAELNVWLTARTELPTGPVFCVIGGVTAGLGWGGSDVRHQLHNAARAAGVTKRVAPHQLRHAHCVDLWRDGIDLFVVMQQLGHTRLDVTALYLRSLAPVDILKPIGQRPAPLMRIRHAT